MSVQNQTVKNVYAGNGSTTVFPFTFALNTGDGEYVGVYIADLTGVSEATDNFTIDTEAGTVTYPKIGDPLPADKKIVIRREIPNEQELNLENLGPFFAEDIEGELDRIVMMIQQLQESDDRAVKVDMSSDITPDQLLEEIADSVEAAATSESHAAKWAEGTDGEVSPLGGTHSAKGWADESHTYANESEIWDEGSDAEVQALGGQHSAQTYAYNAGTSADHAETWAEGSDADVSDLGGTHSAKGWANETAQYVSDAETWAEGTDEEVAPLGGTHSSKGWAADAQASAQSVITNVGKAQTWAEGSDSDVTPLGGEHSSKGWSDQAKAWAMSMANLPVATIVPWGGSSNTPPVGFLFCDGSAVSRTMYPDLFTAIGTTWGAGDGSTTFNLPRSEDLVFQGASATNPVGTYLGAGLPNIEGGYKTGYINQNSLIATTNSTNGAFLSNNNAHIRLNATVVTANDTSTVEFDASQSNAIYGNSDTVQPPAACVRFMIKAFDGQTPDSALIDITQYAADLANKASSGLDNLTQTGEDHFLEQDFTIIYPNGGSESSPANVTSNSRYVETNPFAGYVVNCVAEVQIDGVWGETRHITDYSNGVSSGCLASQLNDGNIIVQTGNSNYVKAQSVYSGDPFGNAAKTYPCPVRVKVWKIGKVGGNA